MKLQEGDIAPEFTTTDFLGNPVSLKEYEGKKLLICFMRYAGCPFCNLSLVKIMEQYPRYHKKGLEVIAFFQSDAKSIKEYPAKHEPPFPIIPDPERKIYDKYNVKTSLKGTLKGALKIPKIYQDLVDNDIKQEKIDGNPFLMPAFFLIGTDGLILKRSYYAADFTEMIPFFEIEDFLLFEGKENPPIPNQ